MVLKRVYIYVYIKIYRYTYIIFYLSFVNVKLAMIHDLIVISYSRYNKKVYKPIIHLL